MEWLELAGGYFLLGANDGFDADGRPVSARAIASAWLKRACWPIYENTRNRVAITPGAKITFYLAGKRDDAQSFVAAAEVAQIRPPSGAEIDQSADFLMAQPAKILVLRNLAYFAEPVSIRPLLGKLSIIKTPEGKWGAGLVGGSRRLSEEDYQLITASR